jgi:hypothetical protein
VYIHFDLAGRIHIQLYSMPLDILQNKDMELTLNSLAIEIVCCAMHIIDTIKMLHEVSLSYASFFLLKFVIS